MSLVCPDSITRAVQTRVASTFVYLLMLEFLKDICGFLGCEFKPLSAGRICLQFESVCFKTSCIFASACLFYYQKYVSLYYRKVQIVFWLVFFFLLEVVVNVNTDWRNASDPYYRSIKSDTQIRKIRETKWRIRQLIQY